MPKSKDNATLHVHIKPYIREIVVTTCSDCLGITHPRSNTAGVTALSHLIEVSI